jgi:MraZ protein
MNPVPSLVGEQISGQSETTIDSKGRVGLPQGLRRYFEDDVTILKWDDHLMVFPPEKFNRLVGYVGQNLTFSKEEGVRNFFNPKYRRDRRHFFGNKFDLSFDSQGRLTIPKTLRESMSFVSDVVWVGCGEYAELWSKKAYDADCARWEEAGGYDELFTAPPPDNPSAPEDEAPGGEGDDREQG